MKNSYLSRREEVVLTTIDLIHELGIKDLSIKEIAKREGVTEASLYKHFKGKEEILQGVIEYYARYDEHIYKSLVGSNTATEGKILRYFTIYGEYFSGYRQITSIFGAYDVLLHDKNFESGIREMIESRNRFLRDLIIGEYGGKQLKHAADPDNLTLILIGSFEKIIFMWRLSGYEFDLKVKVREVIGGILEVYGG